MYRNAHGKQILPETLNKVCHWRSYWRVMSQGHSRAFVIPDWSLVTGSFTYMFACFVIFHVICSLIRIPYTIIYQGHVSCNILSDSWQVDMFTVIFQDLYL